MREMKDSGHETIGLVPSDWTEKRLKYLCKIQTGNEDTQNANPEGKYPFYVRSPIVEHCDRYTFDGEGILVAGDGAGAGRIFHHVYGKYAVHQRVYRLSHFAGNADFIYYYLSNLFPHEMDKGSAQSTVPSMRLPMLLNFPLFLPSKKEQDKIVAFLNSKCSEIDAISADIQKEIEILEQYKRSVITEAVTKGLNPAVEIKDSGVAWCPQIPSHWQYTNPKGLFGLRTDRAFQNDRQLTASQEYGIVYQDEYMEKTGNKVVMVTKDFSILKHVEPDDFVISMRSFQGGLEYSNKRGCISSAYVMLIPNKEFVYAPFYRWFFKSSKYINALQSTSNLVRDGQAMRYANFVKVPLFIIPIEEQKTIASYLDEKIKKVNSILAAKKKQLEILSNYKKSIIYEYVTGKKEVT